MAPFMRAAMPNRLRLAAYVTVVAALGASCNLDPVHRAGVNNLGPEQADAYPPESEFHRPGEPCALCHSKQGPADSTFVLAGTVFWGPENYERRVDQAYVRIIDGQKAHKCFVTNCNGNFFVRPEDFPSITFPLLVDEVVRAKNPGVDETPAFTKKMGSHIGREASCATCHILDLRDFGSPGQIRMLDTEDAVQAAAVPVTNPCPGPEPPVVTQCPEDRL